MLIFIIFVCIAFDCLIGPIRAIQHRNLDDYLFETCSSRLECSITMASDNGHSSSINFLTNKYPHLRILYINGLNDDDDFRQQITVDKKSNIRIIRTKSAVWFRRDDAYINSFDRIDIDEVYPTRDIRINKDCPNTADFNYCFQMVEYFYNDQHEIRCQWLNDSNLVFNHLNVSLEVNKESYKQYTYLNLADKTIQSFEQFPDKLAVQMTRVNLDGARIAKEPADSFLDSFRNVRELNLPDSLFNRTAVQLFARLPLLQLISTPHSMYWRYRDSKYLELYEKGTRCFKLIAVATNDRFPAGCLDAKPNRSMAETNEDLMRDSTLHSVLDRYAFEVAVATIVVLLLISIVFLRCK